MRHFYHTEETEKSKWVVWKMVKFPVRGDLQGAGREELADVRTAQYELSRTQDHSPSGGKVPKKTVSDRGLRLEWSSGWGRQSWAG